MMEKENLKKYPLLKLEKLLESSGFEVFRNIPKTDVVERYVKYRLDGKEGYENIEILIDHKNLSGWEARVDPRDLDIRNLKCFGLYIVKGTDFADYYEAFTREIAAEHRKQTGANIMFNDSKISRYLDPESNYISLYVSSPEKVLQKIEEFKAANDKLKKMVDVEKARISDSYSTIQ